MLFPAYVVHAMEGRVRLRHPVLGTEIGRARALEVLKGVTRVKEAVPGRASILVYLKKNGHLETAVAALCKALESELPELAKTGAPEPHFLRTLLGGVPPRKLENRTLFAALGTSAALGIMGSEKAHVFTAAAFGLLVAHHIWVRRRAL